MTMYEDVCLEVHGHLTVYFEIWEAKLQGCNELPILVVQSLLSIYLIFILDVYEYILMYKLSYELGISLIVIRVSISGIVYVCLSLFDDNTGEFT